MSDFSTITQFVAHARKRHPKIRAYREDDSDGMRRGLAALMAGKTGLAENTFQKLVLSQPEHSDGYEGWARVCFATGRTQEAILLMNHACELIKTSFECGETDFEVLEFANTFRHEIIEALEGST